MDPIINTPIDSTTLNGESDASPIVGKDSASGLYHILFDKQVIALPCKVKTEITPDSGRVRKIVADIEKHAVQAGDIKEVTVTVQSPLGPKKIILYVDLKKAAATISSATHATLSTEQLSRLFDSREKREERIQKALSTIEKQFVDEKDQLKEMILGGSKKEELSREGQKIIELLDHGEKIPLYLISRGNRAVLSEVKKYNDLNEKLFLIRYELLKTTNEENQIRENVEKKLLKDEIAKLEQTHPNSTLLVQKRRELFFLQNKDEWFKESLKTNRGILFSKETNAGKKIVNAFEGKSLKEHFGVHSFIVRYNPATPTQPMKESDFEICVREDNTKILGVGTYKKVVHSEVWRTTKTYAWYIFKGDKIIKESKTPMMQAFFVLIKGQPGFYQPLEEPVDHYKGKGELEEDGLTREPDQEKYITLGTEYIRGNLRDARGDDKPVITGDALVILAEALVFMHDHGFVHRDIKPENYLVNGIIVEFADYDFVESVDEKDAEVIGTKGYKPLSFIFSDLFNYNLLPQNRRLPFGKDGLKQADLFAHALSMWQDLDPLIVEWGCDTSKKQAYYEEINDLIKNNKDPNIKIHPDIRKFFEDLGDKDKKGIRVSPRKFILNTNLLQLSQEAELQKLWIGKKTQEHEARKPQVMDNQNQPTTFFDYRMLLWQATHPDPKIQISPQEFLEKLKDLKTKNLLP